VRATLPWESGLGQKAFFITLSGEKRLGPATTLYRTVALSFVILKRSRGICGSTDLSWRCFSTERSAVERSAVLLRVYCNGEG
jgi:hypothetical protein